MKERHPKSNPKARCCWICGKPGDQKLGMCWGASSALRTAGYNVPNDEIGYAHHKCLSQALRPTTYER